VFITEVIICSFNVPEEKPMEVEEEEEDDQKNPGNLLDNLFRKTKTTPCLYWLPLTDEQVCKTPNAYTTPYPHYMLSPTPSLPSLLLHLCHQLLVFAKPKIFPNQSKK